MPRPNDPPGLLHDGHLGVIQDSILLHGRADRLQRRLAAGATPAPPIDQSRGCLLAPRKTIFLGLSFDVGK